MRKIRFITIFALFMILSSSFHIFYGCDFLNTSESSQSVKITDEEAPIDEDDYASIETSDTQPDTSVTANPADKLEPYRESENRVMFFNTDKDFAFIYPQDRVNLMSNPFLKNESGFLKLSVEIFPENNNYFKENYGFSYKPSIKSHKIFETDVTEYMIFGANSECEVLFERTVLFNRDGSDIKITLSADKETIIESLPEFFVYNEENCGSYSRIWGENKQDIFYEKLISEETNSPAMQWYKEFDLILELLQINEFKGASAGYDRLIDNRIFEEDENNKYLINAFYPEFMPAGSVSDTLNKYIYEDTVLEAVNDFKIEALNADENLKYLLNTDYNVVMFNKEFINLCMDINVFLGGAHGMYYFETFNFDLRENKLLSLADIFQPGFGSLIYLSDHCYVDLKKQMEEMEIKPDEEWIRQGTDPSIPENFSNFLMTPEGIVIKFIPGQAAPGAAGDFSVKISMEDLKDYLLPSIRGRFSD